MCESQWHMSACHGYRVYKIPRCEHGWYAPEIPFLPFDDSFAAIHPLDWEEVSPRWNPVVNLFINHPHKINACAAFVVNESSVVVGIVERLHGSWNAIVDDLWGPQTRLRETTEGICYHHRRRTLWIPWTT